MTKPDGGGPYRIFLSSPGDVADERDRVHAVVSGLSQSLNDVSLEVLDWRRHVAPGIGRSPQAVVDADMDDPYDIYVGIMWSRLGTPTHDAPSGTVHEFRQACARQQRGERVRIMFYFSQRKVAPRQADHLGAVNDFRREIERQGLIREFNDADHFERVLRDDLKLVVQKLVEADRTALGVEQAGRPEAGLRDEDEATGVDMVELRLRLEAKLTWLCKHLLGTPEQPMFATVGSLGVDGYLTREQARIAARVMTGDAGTPSAGDPSERARFREQAEQIVTAFRAVVFAEHVRKLARGADWAVEEFQQDPGHRPDFLIRRDAQVLRVSPRFSIGRSTKLIDNTVGRLARRSDEPDGVTERIVVVPGDRDAPVAGSDPAVLGLSDFTTLLRA